MAPWFSTTQSTAALATGTQLAAISRTLVFVEGARQGHEKHAESKDGIKIPLIPGGWPERKNKNLIQNRIQQDTD